MKVILLQDVSKIGHRFEIVEVPNGYAMNRLIPKGLAKPATPENVKKISAQKEHKQEVVAHREEDFKTAVKKISDQDVIVRVEANDQGHMFETLKAGLIVKALSEQGVKIEETQVVIPNAIKQTGEYTVELKEAGLVESITIKVEAIS